jgi:hypothetical protein
MRFELTGCENVLLVEIANKSMARRDVALTYALALRSGEDVDWKRVNMAIIARWSTSALVWIKTKAWKMLDEQEQAWSEQRQASPPNDERPTMT